MAQEENGVSSSEQLCPPRDSRVYREPQTLTSDAGLQGSSKGGGASRDRSVSTRGGGYKMGKLWVRKFVRTLRTG